MEVRHLRLQCMRDHYHQSQGFLMLHLHHHPFIDSFENFRPLTFHQTRREILWISLSGLLFFSCGRFSSLF
ncbi:hypothetical protein NC652_039702 [Populus alba x Populus x berolinensis]|nr:hypothetical protein NC652_039702 [Populus alba x Populus x berolinensis]